MDDPVKDLFGTEVKVGDILAVAFRAGSSAALRVGRVVGFTSQKDGYSYGEDKRRPQIEVVWDKGSGWSGQYTEGKKTRIFADINKFVVVELPTE